MNRAAAILATAMAPNSLVAATNWQTGPITLTLPEPPSANRWWRNVAGRMVLSRRARQYKQDVALRMIAARVRKIAAPQEVQIELTWYRGRRSGDLDKRIGILLDALQGVAIDNDSQIVRIVATRADDQANPRAVITIAGAAA